MPDVSWDFQNNRRGLNLIVDMGDENVYHVTILMRQSTEKSIVIE